MACPNRRGSRVACVVQDYLKELPSPSRDIYKINNLTSAFTNTYNNTRFAP